MKSYSHIRQDCVIIDSDLHFPRNQRIIGSFASFRQPQEKLSKIVLSCTFLIFYKFFRFQQKVYHASWIIYPNFDTFRTVFRHNGLNNDVKNYSIISVINFQVMRSKYILSNQGRFFNNERSTMSFRDH